MMYSFFSFKNNNLQIAKFIDEVIDHHKFPINRAKYSENARLQMLIQILIPMLIQIYIKILIQI